MVRRSGTLLVKNFGLSGRGWRVVRGQTTLHLLGGSERFLTWIGPSYIRFSFAVARDDFLRS